MKTSEGYVLAYSQISNVLGNKIKDECLTAWDAKSRFSMWATDIWNREWCFSSTGAINQIVLSNFELCAGGRVSKTESTNGASHNGPTFFECTSAQVWLHVRPGL